MTRAEFSANFKLIASPSCNEAMIVLKEPAYFEAVRFFDAFVFLEVIERELRNDTNLDKHLRSPAYYGDQCRHEKNRQDQLRENAKKDPMYGKRPKDIVAAKKFFELTILNHDQFGNCRTEKHGQSNMARCFGLMTHGIIKGMGGKV